MIGYSVCVGVSLSRLSIEPRICIRLLRSPQLRRPDHGIPPHDGSAV